MQTTFSIPGMHCVSCAALIKDVSSEFPVITSAEVDLKQKNVTLTHPDDLDLTQWKTSIEELGPEYKIDPPSAS